MKPIAMACLTVLLALGPGAALAAEKWGLPNEQTARFEAKVVDVLCVDTVDAPLSFSGNG